MNVSDRSVLDLLRRRFDGADPHRPAVISAGTATSWDELDQWSNAVASTLSERGIGSGSIVGVLTARSGALTAGWLGVLGCGAAYVPFALDTPPQRIAFELRETRAAAILVDEAGARLLSGLDAPVPVIDLGGLRTVRAPRLPVPKPGPEDLAVVIYTSGTSGRPKGVMVPHRGLLNTALWWGQDTGLDPRDRLLCTWGSAFDGATFDTFRSLLAGAPLILATDDERRDPRALLRLVQGESGASLTSMTPSLLRAVLDVADAPEADSSTTLRAIYCGGEALSRALANRCHEQWAIPIRNVYGPTETSCVATVSPVEPGGTEAPPIGVPLPGTTARVLGPALEELPQGVPGELVLSGVGVALGYWDRPDLTEQAFPVDPFAADGSRSYRTGDRVLVRDGRLHYLGRMDDQVKILGNRIEPAEVGRLMEEHEAVSGAVVVASGEPLRLSAYVELSPAGLRDADLSHESLVDPLLAWLPSAVLPTEVRIVPSIPLTGNDKVDFHALSAMAARVLDRQRRHEAPLSHWQRAAAELFVNAIGADRALIGELDAGTGFFTVGGHSLLAVTVVAEAEKRHRVTVPLSEFLADPTVGRLAALLETASASGSAPAAEAEAGAEYPATSIQRRLWIMDRVPQLRTAYLAPTLVEFSGPVDRRLLCQATDAVLARHPALRSRFELNRQERRLMYRTDGEPARTTVVDASGLPPEVLSARVDAECWRPFDLAADVPVRSHVFAAGERTLLLLCAHHLVTDGWSWNLIADQIGRAYRALSNGERPVPGPGPHPGALDTSEPDPLAAKEYAELLRQAPTDVDLPYDRPRPQVQDTGADFREIRLGADTTAKLSAAAKEAGVSTFATTAALLAATLARRSRQRDFLFAFPWAGREDPRSVDVVGMFVNTALIRVDLRGEPTWRQVLERVRRSAAEAYAHANVPFDSLVALMQPQRDLGRPPLTPVYLSVEDQAHDPVRLGGSIRSRQCALPSLRLKFELELTARPGDDLGFSLTYATALFDEETVNQFLNDLKHDAAGLANDLDGPAVSNATDLTELIARAWCTVLNLPQVDHDVSFFDAGGDSLLLILLMDELKGLTSRPIEAADLFAHPTVAAQTAFLSGAEQQGNAGQGPRGAVGRDRLQDRARRNGARS